MKRLENKVAIITGAAMGMGMDTAKLFAEEGAKVVVADFNEEAGNAVVKEIIASGGTATFCKVDISDATQVEAMVKFAVSTYGRLDCAVNNAAMKPDNNSFEDLDEEYWDRHKNSLEILLIERRIIEGILVTPVPTEPTEY